MKNLRDYDKITIQEKRQHVAWVSNFLGEELAKQDYAHRRRQQIMLAQRQKQNNYIEEDET